MTYKYKPPGFIDPPGTLRAKIVAEIRRWNDGAGSTVITDYDLPMKGDLTDPAQPATVVLHLRGAKVPFTVRRWGDFKTNLWAVGECIKQMRLSEERGMAETMAAAYLALPPPAGVFETHRDPYDVLHLTRDAARTLVDAVARTLARSAASDAELREVNNARAQIYAERGWASAPREEAGVT